MECAGYEPPKVSVADANGHISLMPAHVKITVGKKKEKEWGVGTELESLPDGPLAGSIGRVDNRLDPEAEVDADGSRITPSENILGFRSSMSAKYSKKKHKLPEPMSSWDAGHKGGGGGGGGADDESDEPSDEEKTLFWRAKRISKAITGVTNYIGKQQQMAVMKAKGAVMSAVKFKDKVVSTLRGTHTVEKQRGDGWASPHAWYALMCSSRYSRMQLIMRCSALNAIEVSGFFVNIFLLDSNCCTIYLDI